MGGGNDMCGLFQESMQYGREGGLNKYQYAANTVAALAFLLLRQQDTAGIALFRLSWATPPVS